MVLAAAGSGRRMGVDKLFAPLAGEPALGHTLRRVMASAVADQVVVATRPDAVDAVRGLVAGMGPDVRIVVGGRRRQDSVGRALAAVEPSIDVVLIHDGARPLASPRLFVRVAHAVQPGAAAVAALPVADTLHHVREGCLAGSLQRAGCWAAQTPQGFDREALLAAMAWGADRDWTDDAGLFAAWGGRVAVVTGEVQNIKLTVPDDLAFARALLAGGTGGRPVQRVGYGWDVHRLVPGRRLVLGGVNLERPDGLGLEGHSDADVLAHAVADAVLGAAAMGDIGVHFPPDDARFAGADSLMLLAEAMNLARSGGWALVNLDATVVADAPRLAPVRDEMCARIARALGSDPAQVSVKATTSEGLQPFSVSAHAVALLARVP